METGVQVTCTDGVRPPTEAMPEPTGGLRVRATLTLRNDKMLAARATLGLSQQRLAEAAETSLRVVRDLEKMRFGRRFGEDAVLRIAVTLGLSPEDILPPGAAKDVPNKFVTVGEVPTERLLEFAEAHRARALLPAPDQMAEQEEVRDKIEQALQTLTFREREIIKLRYGIGDGYTYTLEEVGRIFKITRERVRQTEARALKKLRHPTRWRHFQEVAEKARNLQRTLAPPSITEEQRRSIRTQGVEMLRLGARIGRVLQDLQIRTIGDLTQATAEQLLAQSGFGDSRLKQVRSRLRSFGLSLRVEPEVVPSPPSPPGDEEIIGLSSRFQFSSRVWRALRQLGVRTVRDLKDLTMRDFFGCRGFGPDSMSELCLALRQNGLSLRKVGGRDA